MYTCVHKTSLDVIDSKIGSGARREATFGAVSNSRSSASSLNRSQRVPLRACIVMVLARSRIGWTSWTTRKPFAPSLVVSFAHILGSVLQFPIDWMIQNFALEGVANETLHTGLILCLCGRREMHCRFVEFALRSVELKSDSSYGGQISLALCCRANSKL